MIVRSRPGVFGALATLAVIGSACAGSDDAVDIGDIEVDVSVPDLSLPEITLPDPTTPDVTTGSTFVSPTGDYTIEFPGAPTRTDLPVDLDGETVVADAYLYEDGGDAAYFTSAFDYPDAIIGSAAEDVLVGARDGAISSVGGVVETSDFVERAGVPGIEFTFTIDTPVAGVGTALVLYAEPRLYQSFALGTTGGAADYRRFVDTFQFTASTSPEADQ